MATEAPKDSRRIPIQANRRRVDPDPKPSQREREQPAEKSGRAARSNQNRRSNPNPSSRTNSPGRDSAPTSRFTRLVPTKFEVSKEQGEELIRQINSSRKVSGARIDPERLDLFNDTQPEDIDGDEPDELLEEGAAQTKPGRQSVVGGLAKQAAGQQVDKLKSKAVAAGTERLLALAGPYGEAALAAIKAWQYRKYLIAAVAIILLIVIGSVTLLVVAIGSALQDPSATGTSQTVAYAAGDASTLNQTLNGGAAGHATVSSDSCAGATICLDAEPISEQVGSHCGVATVMTILLYENKGLGNQYFDTNRWIKELNGVKVDNGSIGTCVRPDFLDKNSPPNKRGWKYVSVTTTSGDSIITYIKNSLAGGDPVVLYTMPGGIINGTQHIVPVVGYDSKDDTFIIHNVLPGHSIPYTKTGSNGQKLTTEWIKSHLGQPPNYRIGSVQIRSTYVHQ